MALVMVDVDLWVAISPDYELFVRADPLLDPGYRVRVETCMAEGGLQVRCLAMIPAGFWLRPIEAGPVARPYDTNQFRIDLESEAG